MLLQKRIHQWSEDLPEWQRDLLRRLTAGPLSPDDEQEVLAILTKDANASSPLPLALEDLPADEEEHGPVELREISNLEHINLLASEQELAFKPGINVVFGLTGAGKSGYGRLLRRICRAAHKGEVLRDVFDPGVAEKPQTAHLGISVDGKEQQLTVDLAFDPARVFSTMAVFDARCAGVYLSGPNVIEHVPRSLLMLRQLVEAQDALAKQLDDQAAHTQEITPELPDVATDSEAERQLETLDATTDLAKFKEFASLSEDERAELKQLEVAAATIKSDQSQQLETVARSRARAATNAAQLLEAASEKLTDDALQTGKDIRDRLKSANRANRELADKAFAGQRLPETGQGPWQEMWESARRFVELGGSTFPDTSPNAACPVCQQDLADDARKRMEAFEGFVQSDLRAQIDQARLELDNWVNELPDIDALVVRIEDLLGDAPEEIDRLAKTATSVLADRVAGSRDITISKIDKTPPTLPSIVDVTSITDYATAQSSVAETQAALRDKAEQRRITSRLAELQARNTVAAGMTSVIKYVGSLRKLAQIAEFRAQLGTTKVSNKLRELQQAVITDRLKKSVETELEELDPVAGRIEVIGQAAKGETKIRLRLKEPCRERIGDVLSDGEQRALALAFFLAELAVSDGKSAIILDDPVSSLDHERRTYVARRLIEESMKRQVVVFTHDFTFVYLLQEAAEEAGVELHGQTLQRAHHRIGVVSDALPTKAMSPGRRRKELRRRLEKILEPLFAQQDPSYEREADTWTTDLRKAYDQLIEDYVLAGTVRRWHSQVRIRRLRHIKWNMSIVKRIEAGIKKASDKAHHEASELQPTSFKPGQLSDMLDEFEELCDLAHPEKNKEVQASTTEDSDPAATATRDLQAAS